MCTKPSSSLTQPQPLHVSISSLINHPPFLFKTALQSQSFQEDFEFYFICFLFTLLISITNLPPLALSTQTVQAASQNYGLPESRL